MKTQKFRNFKHNIRNNVREAHLLAAGAAAGRGGEALVEREESMVKKKKLAAGNLWNKEAG